ncbi:MAG: hypothetical protein P8J87_10705, partial [Verrucomicrobiales bacterium]|nr:hypothetical protein [Verrucomicrobiales bacterium]
MNTKITLIIGVSVLSAVITANSAVINYAGVTTNTSITAIPWVTGSTMWGEIETGVAKGTSQVGFSSLDGLDPSKLEWQFGGLELEIGTAVSPGPASAGFEKYIDQGSATSLQFSYDGVLWASATINEFEVNVDDVNDFNAAGVGKATFVSFEPAGSNFFINVMALT